MRTKKLIGKFTASALACAMILSLGSTSTMPVHAQTMDDGLPVLENSSDAEVIADMNEQLSDAMDNYKSYEFGDVIMSDYGIALADATGDSYETNNGPAVATSGRYNKITYGTIHEANDVDWYEIEIVDANTPISVVLTNIPSNCDYDMYLVQYDNTNGITRMYNNLQAGTASEELYGYVEEAGTYYVVVQPDTTLTNNFSTSNYKLYAGNYYRTGSYGWEDTGVDINFGYHPTGTTTNTYSNWYSYNLTNVTTIPEDAILNKFYLDTNGNGAYWAGFYKELVAYTQQVSFEPKLGGIEVMYSGDNEYWVKQDWRFRGYLMVSYSFVWEPRILISYKFPATLQNLRFL